MNKFVFSDHICPNCSFPLVFDAANDSQRILCPNCNASVTPVSAASARRICESSFPDIRNAAALLAFVDTYYQSSLDDDFFTACDTFSAKIVDDAVKNTLLYTANDPIAWRAEYESILLPMEAKLSYLENLPERIATEHLGDNLSEQIYFFDIYESTLKAFLPYVEAVRSRLELASARAEKFGMSKKELSSLEERFEKLASRLTELCKDEKFPKDPTELEAVKKAKEQRDARITEALMAMGVSAEDTYSSATALAKKKKGAQALDMFRQLGAYKDSAQQMAELDCYKKFDDIRSIAGRLYLFNKRQDTKAKKSKEQPKSLFELIPLGDAPVSDALDAPIHKIIATYADKIYYLDKEDQLTCLDLQDNINRSILLDGKNYLFSTNTKFYLFDNLSKLAVAAKEKVVIEKGRNKGKLRQTDTDLLIIDLSNEEMTLCDFGIEDIECICDGYVFYKKNNTAASTSDASPLVGYNVITGKRVTMPPNVYKIHAIVDEYIIFSYKKSSPYNLSLCALCCGVTSFERVLEDNILDFTGVIDKKIYYTIGSYDMRILCRIDPVTLERSEIQRAIKAKSGSEILLVRDGWMYFKKGDDKNTVLARCRADGGSYHVVCTSFERFACKMPFIRGFVYYIDINGCLCRALISGYSPKVISDNIAKDIGVLSFHQGKIYFARNEYTGKCAAVKQSGKRRSASSIVQTDKYSLSLYSCDLDGQNLRKLCFDFDYVWSLSKSALLIRRVESEKFITPKKHSVIENTKVCYEIIDLNEPSKVRLLTCFSSSNSSSSLPKGVTPVTLKDEAKAEKLPPIK